MKERRDVFVRELGPPLQTHRMVSWDRELLCHPDWDKSRGVQEEVRESRSEVGEGTNGLRARVLSGHGISGQNRPCVYSPNLGQTDPSTDLQHQRSIYKSVMLGSRLLGAFLRGHVKTPSTSSVNHGLVEQEQRGTAQTRGRGLQTRGRGLQTCPVLSSSPGAVLRWPCHTPLWNLPFS